MATTATDIVLLYVTTRDASEAREIGRSLVAERLAACANVLPEMTSVYEWEGELSESREAVLLLKTRAELADAATARVLELHSYDTPAVLALPVTGGSRAFASWIAQQSGPR